MVNIRTVLKELFSESASTSESKNLRDQFEFIIKGNTDLKRVIAHIASNILVKYSVMAYQGSKVNIFYETQTEQIVTEIFYYDMALELFEYLPVIIDIIGEDQLRDICLNKDTYLKDIKFVISKQEEYKSCLLSRVLEKRLNII